MAAPGIDVSLSIAAPRALVLKAFFDPDALGAWWQARRSLTTPRVLGPYAVEWRATEFRDEVLGRLGGVFRGTVVQYEPEQGFFVADAYWLPPDTDPIGPMALNVQLSTAAMDDGQPGTHVRVTQSGFEPGVRWQRYYDVVGVGWERALHSLKMLLEK